MRRRFAFRPIEDAGWLREIGLCDQQMQTGDDVCVWRQGTQSLTDKLAGALRGGRLMRMAVSSIGVWRGRYMLCLENGMMLDAGALIIAAPARYAARMLYNLAPAAAAALSGFRYDSIHRLSLGIRKRDLPAKLNTGDAERFPFVLTADTPGRVPDCEHRLLQVGVRADAAAPPDELFQLATRHLGLAQAPLTWRVDHWPEADLDSCCAADHRDALRLVHAALPAGISLIGSDTIDEAPPAPGIARLDERIRAGRQAARDAIAHAQRERRR